MLWLFVGAILGFNVVFNHSMACLIKANGPTELKIIESLRLAFKRRQGKKEFVEASDRFEGLSTDVKRTLKYRNKTLDDLRPQWRRNCRRCNEIKPTRTHHCSVCNRCVFMMDHHCPWVNNCLGMENYRYFLLFIFYLMIGSAWYTITIMSIWNHHSYVSKNLMLTLSSTHAEQTLHLWWSWTHVWQWLCFSLMCGTGIWLVLA